jgi:hypothetical protein
VAADVTQQANDSGELEPMVRAARHQLKQAGIGEQPQTVLADGGYWNSAQITALGEQRMQVIVPTKSAVRTKKRTLSPRQGPEATRIQALLETREGAALYRERQHIIETVFARTKFLRGITRFQRRGSPPAAPSGSSPPATTCLSSTPPWPLTALRPGRQAPRTTRNRTAGDSLSARRQTTRRRPNTDSRL